MIDGLRKYFPMIRTEKEILTEIQGKNALNTIYQRWTREQQKDFLNMATGMRGMKVLYDSYFKEIFNPELKPERLEAFLSLPLKQKIKIKAILPGDNSRISDESSLLIMDILVELEDGSLANVEAQKIGYKFPASVVLVTPPTCSSDNTNVSTTKRKRRSATGTSKRCIRSFCLKQVRKHFTNFRMTISIISGKRQTRAWILIFCKYTS